MNANGKKPSRRPGRSKPPIRRLALNVLPPKISWLILLKNNMPIIIRASGVVMRNKKILLVSAGNRPFYWTPDGKLEPRETALDALHREFQEELGVKITAVKRYLDYQCSAEEEEIINPGKFMRL